MSPSDVTRSARRTLHRTALVLSLLSTVLAGCADDSADAFSVMTFNVRHRHEAASSAKRDKYTWEERSGELLNMIIAQAPDVLAAQELNDLSWIGAAPAHDSVQTLLLDGLRASGDYGAYMNAADDALFVNDCASESATTVRARTPKAIFFRKTRFKCLRSGSVKLPGETKASGGRISRYASWVVLERLQNGQAQPHKYFVINLHLAAGDNEPVRLAAMTQLIPVVQANAQDGGCPIPVILAGDFNSRPDSAPINLVTAGLDLVDSYQGKAPTASAWGTMSSRLDFVLHSRSLDTASANVVAFPGIAASDHLPLKATLVPNMPPNGAPCAPATDAGG